MNYKEKYFKYKNKYLKLKYMIGGDPNDNSCNESILDKVYDEVFGILKTIPEIQKIVKELIDNNFKLLERQDAYGPTRVQDGYIIKY